MLFKRAVFIAVIMLAVSPAETEAQEFRCYEPNKLEEMTYSGKPVTNSIPEGKPRMVRAVYLLPNDRQFRQAAVDSIKDIIQYAQNFFGSQMEIHGYGYKTFQFEADADGPIVHTVYGKHSSDYYAETLIISNDIPSTHKNVYIIAIDHVKDNARGARHGKKGGIAIIPFPLSKIWLCHELGHAFGLTHDFRDGSYVMSYGWSHNGNTGQNTLSKCAAEFLYVNPLLNPDIPLTYDGKESITTKLISANEYPAGANSLSIKLELSDSNGLHQIQLAMSPNGQLKLCRGFNGVKNAIVEFDYDGVPQFYSSGINLASYAEHKIRFRIINIKGNMQFPSFVFVETVPNPDFNGDGLVTIADFFMFAESFGSKQGEDNYNLMYDMNLDMEINLDDFWIFVEAFGS